MPLHLDSVRYLLPPCSRSFHAEFHNCFHRVPSSAWCGSRLRRWLDLVLAVLLLAICTPAMVMIVALIRLTSRGPALIRQQRVGRGGKLFNVVKFRTMAHATGADPGLTMKGDSRVTAVGVALRRFKLDELPQLFNVLCGEMSLVGPRPKLPRFAEIPNMPYRPGLTGPASAVFCSEDRILSRLAPEEVEPFYLQRIKPLKANLDICYMCRATPASDARVMAATALGCVAPGILAWLFGRFAEARVSPLFPGSGDTSAPILEEGAEAYSGLDR